MVKGVPTIGIVGGGQLGRMLTLAAKPMGYDVTVIDPSDNCPASQVGATQIKADLYSSAALKELNKVSDLITIEFEHIDAKELYRYEKLGQTVHPSAQTIELIQDKFIQKEFLSSLGVKIGAFEEIDSDRSAEMIFGQYKKILIKSRMGGFDGRGNALVTNTKELNLALKKFQGQKIYAEEYIPFVKELAVMVAKSVSGEIIIYPVVETRQERNICVEVLAPARISEEIEKKAKSMARLIAKNLVGAGVYGIEMFLTKSDEVLLNEIAPRVHNSGHYTIEGCATSQFTQHIRAVSGMSLGSTEMLYPAVVMVNILGKQNKPTKVVGLEDALKTTGVTVHIYGKSPTKVDRKMGHITAYGETIEVARRRANQALRRISI
jgi:5-(carboxyamino)imidazole ribonucleotide synthase